MTDLNLQQRRYDNLKTRYLHSVYDVSLLHIAITSATLQQANAVTEYSSFNPLNAELNPICYLLALLELTIFSTLAG